MKMKYSLLFVFFCFFLLNNTCEAQDTLPEYQPTITATIKTLDGRMHTRVLLLNVSDTEVTYYHRFTGEIDHLSYDQIKKIKIKLNGRIGLGVLAGLIGSGGLAAIYIHQVGKTSESLYGADKFFALAVGAGAIIGGLFGATLTKPYKIKGDHERFLKFKNGVKKQEKFQFSKYIEGI